MTKTAPQTPADGEVEETRPEVAHAQDGAVEAVHGANAYRKKPVVIEAVQYGPYTAPTLELALFLDGAGAYATADGIIIPTLEGDHLATVGDYIIKGVKGEFYPCKPDIFAMTYEPAATPTPDTLIDDLMDELRDAKEQIAFLTAANRELSK